MSGYGKAYTENPCKGCTGRHQTGTCCNELLRLAACLSCQSVPDSFLLPNEMHKAEHVSAIKTVASTLPPK